MRCYDVNGDGFLTDENLTQLGRDAACVLTRQTLRDEVASLAADLERHAGDPPIDLDALAVRAAQRANGGGSGKTKVKPTTFPARYMKALLRNMSRCGRS